jgi:hypothetical protein
MQLLTQKLRSYISYDSILTAMVATENIHFINQFFNQSCTNFWFSALSLLSLLLQQWQLQLNLFKQLMPRILASLARLSVPNGGVVHSISLTFVVTVMVSPNQLDVYAANLENKKFGFDFNKQEHMTSSLF